MFIPLVLVAAQLASWQSVAAVFGKDGELAQDGSYKVTFLRTDLQVQNSQGMLVPPEMGLNSYAAFMGTPEKATVVGDTCMVSTEIDAVVDRLRAGKIEVVALHSHMAGESPTIYFLHFQGQGSATSLAATINGAFRELGKDRPIKEGLKRTGDLPIVDWKAVSSILGRPVTQVGSSRVMKATFPRSDLHVTLDGTLLVPGAGLSCWAAFGGCPCGKTMLMGDTVVTRAEAQNVIDACRRFGISVTAIHNHTLGQDGSLMFMHIEAEGDAIRLATGVRAAWDCLGR